VCVYALLFVEPVAAAILGWPIAMISRPDPLTNHVRHDQRAGRRSFRGGHPRSDDRSNEQSNRIRIPRPGE
jgi:hypothetical protein